MLGYTNCSRSNVLMHFQEYFQKSNATDASGNMVLSDIGVHLQQKVSLFLSSANVMGMRRWVEWLYPCWIYGGWTVFNFSHAMPQIKSHFKDIGVHSDVKYIDPTYMLRAVRANASDAILCTVLGQNAVRYHFSLLPLCLMKKILHFSCLTICLLC